MELIALLMTHFMCNEMAATQVMPIHRANQCSDNFEQVKIALNPDLTWEDFEALDPSDQAAISVMSYQHYVDWKAANPGSHRAMVQDAKALVNPAM